MKSLLWRRLSPTALQIAFMIICLIVAGLFIYLGATHEGMARISFILFASAFFFSSFNCVFFILKGPSPKKGGAKEENQETSKRYKTFGIVNAILFIVEAVLVIAGIIVIAVM